MRNNVTEEEIAEVVSKWTGIPVSKMLEGEREKLLRMEDGIGTRVVGQDEAVTSGIGCDSTFTCRPVRSKSTQWLVSCFWGRPAWVKPS